MTILGLPVIGLVNEEGGEEQFEGRHWLQSKTGDGKDIYMMSGNAIFNIRGTNEGRRGAVTAVFFIGDPRNPTFLGDNFHADYWVVQMVPSAWRNEGHAINGRFAVERTRMLNLNNNHIKNGKRTTSMQIAAEVEVRDSDAYLEKIAFAVTLVGHTELPEAPPTTVAR